MPDAFHAQKDILIYQLDRLFFEVIGKVLNEVNRNINGAVISTINYYIIFNISLLKFIYLNYI